MAVVIETTLGDITVDLYLEQRPVTCLNFLKLCKMKYYNFNLFHTIRSGFIAQTGDPSGEGAGGQSIFGLLEGPEKRFFSGEKMPKIRHTNAGLLSMVCTDDTMVGSQFFFTLAPDLDSLDGIHCVIGEVTEGHDVLRKLNEVICDETHRPYQDVRITHTVILEDPFKDPSGFHAPSRSPSPSVERLKGGRIAPDEELDETQGKSAEEIQEMIEEKEAKARATILEIVGDLPDAEIAPPENVLFVCKLNPVTNDEDLEIIFSRFGKIVSCEVIRDKKTGDSLQYAFIEFSDKKSCEDAYFKMDNVLIDDRRIHVDFSQSVSKMRWLGKGRGVQHFDDDSDDNTLKNKNKFKTPNEIKDRKNHHQYDKEKTNDDQRKDYDKDHEKSRRSESEDKRNDKDTRRDSKRRHENESAINKNESRKRQYDNNRDSEKDQSRKRHKNDKEINNRDSERDKRRRSENESRHNYRDLERERDRRRHHENNSKQKDRRDRSRSRDNLKTRREHPKERLSRNSDNNAKQSYKKNQNNDNNKSGHTDSKEKSEKSRRSPSRNFQEDISNVKENKKSKDYKDNHEEINKAQSMGNSRNDMKKREADDGESKTSERLIKDQTINEPQTPSPSEVTKKNKKKIKDTDNSRKKVRSNKKKRKPSTSSDTDSSETSSSSESSSSSGSDRKKRRTKKKRKYSSSSSSDSSESSTSSSSSSDSSSDSSSSSSDSENDKKKSKKNVKKKLKRKTKK